MASDLGRKVARAALTGSETELGSQVAASKCLIPLQFSRLEKADPGEFIRTWQAESEQANSTRKALLGIWIQWARDIAPRPLTPHTVRVSLLNWGGLRLIGMPGELFSATGIGLRQELGTEKLMLAGFCDDNPGYIPPASEYARGGYEVEEAHCYYGMPATFAAGSAEALNDQEAFDAVFSNAALHWVKDHPQVLKRVYRALKPGGRFVGECGGRGNVAAVVVAIMAACSEEGLDGLSLYPWRFVSASTFLGHLREAGFNASDEEVTLFSRTTPLPTGLCGWLETFAVSFLGAVPDGRRSAFLARVEELAAPALRDEDGNWHADYVRLRFQARKPG